jgi:hypothetical protein
LILLLLVPGSAFEQYPGVGEFPSGLASGYAGGAFGDELVCLGVDTGTPQGAHRCGERLEIELALGGLCAKEHGGSKGCGYDSNLPQEAGCQSGYRWSY